MADKKSKESYKINNCIEGHFSAVSDELGGENKWSFCYDGNDAGVTLTVSVSSAMSADGPKLLESVLTVDDIEHLSAWLQYAKTLIVRNNK